MNIWSDEQIEFLKLNFGKISNKEIAIKVNKNRASIYRKANNLKLNFCHFCERCQTSKDISCFGKNRNGRITSPCKKCKSSGEKLYHMQPTSRFKNAKTRATGDGRIWKIEYQDWLEMVNKPCHYCGHQINKTGSGLDRKNSLGNYTIDNVCQCCSVCNKAFTNYFEYEEKLLLGKLIGEIKNERIKNNIDIDPKISHKSRKIGPKENHKYKGVNKSGKYFISRIRINGHKQYLGTFETEQDAAKNYDFHNLKINGPEVYLNFPNEDYNNFQPQRKILPY